MGAITARLDPEEKHRIASMSNQGASGSNHLTVRRKGCGAMIKDGAILSSSAESKAARGDTFRPLVKRVGVPSRATPRDAKCHTPATGPLKRKEAPFEVNQYDVLPRHRLSMVRKLFA